MKIIWLAVLWASIGCIVVSIYAQPTRENPKAGKVKPADSEPSKIDAVNVDTVNVTKLSVQQQETAGKPDNNQKESKSYPSRLVAPENFPNLILCMVGIAGIFVGLQTLNAIQRQAGQMERQTKILIEYNIATRESADAAKKNAEFAQRSVESMISKERARIHIKMVDKLELAPPGDAFPFDQATYQLFCHGTSPAYILERMGRISVGDSKNPVREMLHPICSSLPDVVYPSPDAIKTGTVHFFTDMDDAKRDAIREGKLFVHFYGHIRYRDVFENIRETKFQYLWRVTDMKNLDGTPFSYWTTDEKEEENSQT